MGIDKADIDPDEAFYALCDQIDADPRKRARELKKIAKSILHEAGLAEAGSNEIIAEDTADSFDAASLNDPQVVLAGLNKIRHDKQMDRARTILAIQKGTFGKCMCGVNIAFARVATQRYVTECVSCKAKGTSGNKAVTNGDYGNIGSSHMDEVREDRLAGELLRQEYTS